MSTTVSAKKICRKCHILRSCKVFILVFIVTIVLVAISFSIRAALDKANNANHSLGNRRVGKILCYILLPPIKLEAGTAIKETWGSKCDKLMFFGHFNHTELPVTFLNASEGYRFLWGKTQAALLHLAKEYSQNYDWFFKADHDTFVVVENLRHFVGTLDPSSPIWFGYKLKHPQLMTGYMSGGAGYGFSKAALLRVIPLLAPDSLNETIPKCRSSSPIGLEDIELGKCFTASGVRDESTVDGSGKERFLPLPIEILWNKQVPPLHWLWRQAWNPLVVGKKCCSSHVISTHKISPNKMRALYRTLYKPLKTP